MASVLEAIQNSVVADLGMVEGYATFNGAPAIKAVPLTEMFTETKTEGGSLYELNPLLKPDSYPGAIVSIGDMEIGSITASDQHAYNGGARTVFKAPLFIVIFTRDSGAASGAARRDAQELLDRSMLRLQKLQPDLGVPDYATTEVLRPVVVDPQQIDSTSYKIGIQLIAGYALAS